MRDDDDEHEVGIGAPEGWEGTHLEIVETAHLACRAAWLWPEDDEQRVAAILASSQAGVDYILQLEKIVGIVRGPLDQAIDRARREMAEGFRLWADRLYIEKITGIQHVRDANESE